MPFMSYRLDAHDRGHRDEGSFDDPGGTAELTLERWIAGDVDEVHLPVLPLGVLERHRDGELTLVLVIGRVRDGRPRLDRPKAVDFPGLEEERLDERRLSRPAVTDDGDVGSWRARAWAVSPPQGIRLQVEKLGVVRRPAFERRSCPRFEGEDRLERRRF